MRFKLIILLFILSFKLSAQNNLKIKVVKGEVLNSIFKKYLISKFPCNDKEFCELNSLKSKELILANKTYLLPIKIFQYDGKSIRSTLGITNLEIAKKIETYNKNLLINSVKKEDFKNGVLWVPNHLLEKCSAIKNSVPEKVKLTTKVFPIFGKNHESVEIVDAKLKGTVFYLVSGHGGPDPGAIGKLGSTSLCEDEYSYDITLRLAKNLISHGSMVYLIIRDTTDGIRATDILKCDHNETCWTNQTIPLNQKKRLTQRSDAVNELYLKNKTVYKHQYMIVLHIDSQSKSKRADMYFYHHESSKLGKKLANHLHKTIKENYKLHQKGRGYSGTVTKRDLHMVRESYPATVYIELGNLMNPQDQKRFLMSSNRQAVADWLVLGILKN